MGRDETVRGFESKIKTPIMITITIMITIKERTRRHCYLRLRGVFCAVGFCRMNLIPGSRARSSGAAKDRRTLSVNERPERPWWIGVEGECGNGAGAFPVKSDGAGRA